MRERLAVRRMAAYLLDGLVILLYLAVLSGLSWSLRGFGVSLWFGTESPEVAQCVTMVFLSIPAALYLGLCESSRRQATIGKRLLGLRVESLEGGRIKRSQALARAGLKLFLPWEIAHYNLYQMAEPMLVEPQMELAELMEQIEPSGWELVFMNLPMVLILMYVVSLFRRQGRTVYDQLTRTRVVRAVESGSGGH